MSAFFSLIPIKSISKPVVIPLTQNPETDLFFKDFNQLKIYFLVFAIGGLSSLIKMIWDFIKNKNLDINGRFKEVEKSQAAILASVQKLELYLAQIKDSQISESEIRTLVRDEMNYATQIQRHKRT